MTGIAPFFRAKPSRVEVREIEMRLWLSIMAENVELQCPPCPKRDEAITMLNGWIDDLPIYSRLMQ
jgi:hypothetical protein